MLGAAGVGPVCDEPAEGSRCRVVNSEARVVCGEGRKRYGHREPRWHKLHSLNVDGQRVDALTT